MMLAATNLDTAPGVLVEISLRDEGDLRAYFALSLPAAPGASSGLGPMCQRMANRRNPKTEEVPTPKVSWTEIVHCSGGLSLTTDGEDAFIAYVDARRRMQRVHDALVRLTTRDASVLFAHYSREERPAGPWGRLTHVAALAETAVAENRARAARDRHESVGETLDSLAATLKVAKVPKDERERTRLMIAAIRREAASMLQTARANYSRARSEGRS